MTIKVCGHRVLIKPHYPEEKTESGIIVGLGKQYELEKNATQEGEVVGIGPTAWSDPGLGGKPWCKMGDIVMFARHAGKKVREDEEEYFIINDEDVQCIMREADNG